MWCLLRYRLNLNKEYYLRFPTLTSIKNYSTKNVSVTTVLKNCQRLLMPSHCENLFTNKNSVRYKFCVLQNVNEFSTTNALLKSKNRGTDKKKKGTQHIDLNELGEVLDTASLLEQYDKTIDNFKESMIKQLALRSSTGVIEELCVKFDGQEYELQELVQISRKPKMIILNASAFPQTIPDVMKVLIQSKMNLNPQQEGTTIYVPIPKVTKEHRENLSKTAKSYFTKCQENIREVRNKHIKEVKKQAGLPEDLVRRVESYIDQLSHQYNDKAQELLQMKQKELLGNLE